MESYISNGCKAPLILNLDTRIETNPVPSEQAGWVPGSVWAFWTTDKAGNVGIT
jgi:hypothetical protein